MKFIYNRQNCDSICVMVAFTETAREGQYRALRLLKQWGARNYESALNEVMERSTLILYRWIDEEI